MHGDRGCRDFRFFRLIGLHPHAHSFADRVDLLEIDRFTSRIGVTISAFSSVIHPRELSENGEYVFLAARLRGRKLWQKHLAPGLVK
jgi:hypothetical protein